MFDLTAKARLVVSYWQRGEDDSIPLADYGVFKREKHTPWDELTL